MKKTEDLIPEFPSSDEDESDYESQFLAESDDEFTGFSDRDEPLSKRTKKSKKAPTEKSTIKLQEESSAVVYVGRIPHGFYETEMKAYFSQFGTVVNLRLSRNKNTGKPKHYAFVEFESPETALIVCESMDNYLLFDHILKVKPVPQSQLHPDLFKGANHTYRPVDHVKRALHSVSSKKSKDQAEKLQINLLEAIERKNRQLADLGIDYQYVPKSRSKENTNPEDKKVKEKTKLKAKTQDKVTKAKKKTK